MALGDDEDLTYLLPFPLSLSTYHSHLHHLYRARARVLKNRLDS